MKRIKKARMMNLRDKHQNDTLSWVQCWTSVVLATQETEVREWLKPGGSRSACAT
jgi:hypothetical protein